MSERLYIPMRVEKSITAQYGGIKTIVPFSDLGWFGVLPVFETIDALHEAYPNAEYATIEKISTSDEEKPKNK